MKHQFVPHWKHIISVLQGTNLVLPPGILICNYLLEERGGERTKDFRLSKNVDFKVFRKSVPSQSM
jgi:hypothetical protein